MLKKYVAVIFFNSWKLKHILYIWPVFTKLQKVIKLSFHMYLWEHIKIPILQTIKLRIGRAKVICAGSQRWGERVQRTVSSEPLLFQGYICQLDSQREIPVLLPTDFHSRRKEGSDWCVKSQHLWHKGSQIPSYLPLRVMKEGEKSNWASPQRHRIRMTSAWGSMAKASF